MLNTIISDNFNRANGAVGNGWTETTANTWTINNNKLTTVGTTALVLYKNTNKLEHQIVVETNNLNGYTVATTRYNPNTKNGYYAIVQKTTNINLFIGKWSDNGATSNTLIADTLVTNVTDLRIEFLAISTYPTTLYFVVKDLNENTLKALLITDNTSELQTQTNVGVSFFSNDTNVGVIDNIVVNEYVSNSIKANDSKLILSPYNWNLVNTTATTISPGSYFKCKFTGTYLELRTDITNYLTANSTDYPKLKYFIDNKTSNEITINNSRIVISGLSDSEHEFIGFINSTSYALERWTNPVSKFVLKELAVDDNKEFKTVNKYNENVLVIGDSITEGLLIDAGVNKFSNAYSYYLTRSLSKEVGIVGYGGVGFSVAGGNNVPKAVTNVDYYYANNTRIVNGKLNPIPNQVIINLGTNDAVSNVNTNTLKTDIKTLINKLISYSNKYTKIIVLIPFGGFAKQTILDTINELNNKQIEVIDLNEYVGLDNTGASYKSTDGVHPNLEYSAYLGSKLVNKLTSNNSKNKLLELLAKQQINLNFNDLINTKVIRDYLSSFN